MCKKSMRQAQPGPSDLRRCFPPAGSSVLLGSDQATFGHVIPFLEKRSERRRGLFRTYETLYRPEAPWLSPVMKFRMEAITIQIVTPLG